MYLPFSSNAIALVLCTLSAAANTLAAEIVITSLDEDGHVQQVPRAKLVDDEITALELFEHKEPPSEIYLLAEGRPYTLHLPELGNDYSTTMLLRYPNRWELRWYTAASRRFYHERRLSDAEAEPVTELVKKTAVHQMPRLDSMIGTSQIVGGGEYAFIYLTPRGGSRVLINNPFADRGKLTDPLRKYRACVDVFRKLVEYEESWQVTYTYHRRLKGVEHVSAHPRRPVKELIVKDGRAYVAIGATSKPHADPDWFVLENGKLQPASDPLEMAPDKSPEVRNTRLSADGKWLAGNLRSDGSLICRNRIENTGVNIPDEVARIRGVPLYFLESHQAFVISVVRETVFPGRTDSPYVELFALLPATGELVGLGKLSTSSGFISGEKVWRQRMPEKLQAVQKSIDEVWLSAPQGRAMEFGKYNTKTLEWVRAQHIPDAQFSPRDFFVDEQAKKLYFREDDQLLATALPAVWFE